MHLITKKKMAASTHDDARLKRHLWLVNYERGESLLSELILNFNFYPIYMFFNGKYFEIDIDLYFKTQIIVFMHVKFMD